MQKRIAPPTSVALLLVCAFLVMSCSGCLWLMLPGLAYQGYKYEKGPSAQQQPDQQSGSSKSASSSSDSE